MLTNMLFKTLSQPPKIMYHSAKIRSEPNFSISMPFVCQNLPCIKPYVVNYIPVVCPRSNRGFSLIELIVTLTIAAILLGISVPSLIGFVRSNRLASVTNTFISDINLARSEALKRGIRAGVCQSGGATGCTGSGTWNTGWVVFADLDDSKAWTASDVVLLKRDAISPEMAITASTVAIIYDRRGMAETGAGNYSFCNTALGKTKAITVDATGRHRLADGAC